MKQNFRNIFIICIILSSELFGQSDKKGFLKFTYNKEKIEIPITLIYLNKQDDVRLSIRAEKNDENVAQMVNLELLLDPNEIYGVNSNTPTLLTAQISLADYKRDNSRNIYLQGNGNEYNCKYELSKAKDRSWKYFGLSTKMNEVSFEITEKKIENNSIVYKGKFSIYFPFWKPSKKVNGKEVQLDPKILPIGDDDMQNKEIKDGYFEIII